MARVSGKCGPPVRTKKRCERELELTGSVMKVRIGHAAIMPRRPPSRVYFDADDIGHFN